MNKLDVLLNIITLLYRESNTDNAKDNNSIILVNGILDHLTEKKFTGVKRSGELVVNLIKIISDIITTNLVEPIDKNMLSQTVSLVLKEDPETLSIFKDSLNIDNNEELRISINRLRRRLDDYKTEIDIKKALNLFAYQFSNERKNLPNLNEFIENMKDTFTNLKKSKGTKDPAIVDELDLNNPDDITNVVEAIKEEDKLGGKLITGWQAFNRMTRGGIRGGEFTTISALQHQYKTGTTLSIFFQMALFNEPKLIDPKKKPLLLWISFEDDVKNIILFAFMYLYINEHKEAPDVKNFTSKEIQEYVSSKLTARGFTVKILRINPTEWTYKDIFNKTEQYENSGYEVKVLGLDYLSMIPTIGCITTGPMGTDLRDLFRRVRNYYSARKVAVMTPHQLSSDAKRLTRNGVPDASFVKEVAGKGYYSGSTQLDQEIDLEIFVHKTKANGSTYLTFQRGKHRLPGNIPETDMYFMLKFPKFGPILDDLQSEDSSLKSLSDVTDNSFGL